MANNLYDTGKPQRIIVEHQVQFDHEHFVEWCGRVAMENLRNFGRIENGKVCKILDAEFEVIEEPKRKQLK